MKKNLFISWIVFFLFFSCSDNKQVKEEKERPRVLSTKADEKPFVVMIQPLGSVSDERLRYLQQEIKSFYNCDSVIIAATQGLPKSAWYEPRKRYVADSLLVFLKNKKPQTVQYVIGLTDKDIATKKDDNPNYGILGLGFCPGVCCVVSTFRLKRRIAGNKKLVEKVFLERLSKVCLHELGHNFGLPHCTVNDSCFMNDADGTISQVDRERRYLCETCRKKIAF